MAVPKKKTSKSKRNQRHAVWKGKAAVAAQRALSIGKSVLPPLISTVFAALGGWAFLGLLLLFAVRPH